MRNMVWALFTFGTSAKLYKTNRLVREKRASLLMPSMEGATQCQEEILIITGLSI